jgi:hypothetical protein
MHKNFNSQNYGHGPGVDAGYLKKKKKKKKKNKKNIQKFDILILVWAFSPFPWVLFFRRTICPGITNLISRLRKKGF